jgi:hypothetical protein
VGRPSDWGNPFTWKSETIADIIVPKDEVLTRYAEWLLARTDLVDRARRELRGKVLGCWCRPSMLCHGDILAVIANAIEIPKNRS